MRTCLNTVLDTFSLLDVTLNGIWKSFLMPRQYSLHYIRYFQLGCIRSQHSTHTHIYIYIHIIRHQYMLLMNIIMFKFVLKKIVALCTSHTKSDAITHLFLKFDGTRRVITVVCNYSPMTKFNWSHMLYITEAETLLFWHHSGHWLDWQLSSDNFRCSHLRKIVKRTILPFQWVEYYNRDVYINGDRILFNQNGLVMPGSTLLHGEVYKTVICNYSIMS